MDFDPRTEWRPEDWQATEKALRRAEIGLAARKVGGITAGTALVVGTGWAALSVVAPQQLEAWKTAWGGQPQAQVVESTSVESTSVESVESESPVSIELADVQNPAETSTTWEEALNSQQTSANVLTDTNVGASGESHVALEPALEPALEASVTKNRLRILDLEGIPARSLGHGGMDQLPMQGVKKALSEARRAGLSWSLLTEGRHGGLTGQVLLQRHLLRTLSVEAGLGIGWDNVPVQWSAWHPTDAFGGQEWRVAQSESAVVAWTSWSALADLHHRIKVGGILKLGWEGTRKFEVGVQDPNTLNWVEGIEPEQVWGQVAEANPWRGQFGLRCDMSPKEGWWVSAQMLREAPWRGSDNLGPIAVVQQPWTLQIGVVTWR